MFFYNLELTSSTYSMLAVFSVVSLILGIVIYILSYGMATHTGDSEKLSSYECGFDPFEDSRVQFDVHFYLVAILFIVFDLEAVFLFPWATTRGHLDPLGFFSMFDFVIELVVGYYYVWMIGALEV
jgi:NADH-quinone oxidoreductase subunit A